MYESKTRNIVITIVGMAFAFTAWVLSGIFGWENVEWIVGTILGLGGFSTLRALGDYKRTDAPTNLPTEAEVDNTEKTPD